ncbi:MAG TPA: glycoside hydrolase family 9 protein [Longimicrobiales bacterium]|nr:glycoside hydrolase family 9 protein [Longimicrobiales bacterium]
MTAATFCFTPIGLAVVTLLRHGAVVAMAACIASAGCGRLRHATSPGEAERAAEPLAIRVNQLGYLPEGPKVAVLCSLDPRPDVGTFAVVTESGDTALGPIPMERSGALGPCAAGFRLDFSGLREPGRYRVVAGKAVSRPVRVAPDAYQGAADTLLAYLRQQRSGFNPLFRDSVHHRTDAILVDHPTRSGEWIPVAGGWADAADYLQYVTTSAHATYMLLMAWRDHPASFGDAFDAAGLPGSNGLPDVLDEARWGLEWLLSMFPEDDLLLNQVGDDRDHAFPDLPVTDSSDYGWGRGGMRPVYPCTGKPQGLLRFKNRSDGLASTAGKLASAFALGSSEMRSFDAKLADRLEKRAVAAYRLGRAHPGVCQTAPAGAPYFYEEANWVDDMELAAAQLYELTGDEAYVREAVEYARQEPMTPWMGQDTARHYEWFPWHNNGHYQLWRAGRDPQKRMGAEFYRRGLEAVAARADNAFRVGIPFIWCSNNLMVSFATQARLYRTMTGDTTYRAHEQAALDWIFGANPWGVSMVIGLPADGVTPRDPHSIVAKQLGVGTQTGGLVDGPVYRSIFESLLYVRLSEPDEYSAWNGGSIVYHDDWGDYSTNEPIMDGTANLVWLLAALAFVPPS